MEMALALVNLNLAIPDAAGKHQLGLKRRNEVVLKAGQAIGQLWHDLKQEERGERKAIA